MWILEALVLIVSALAAYSIRAWILLLSKECVRKTCPRCGSPMVPTESATAAGLIRQCTHCRTLADPLKTSKADRWINSPLKPPE